MHCVGMTIFSMFFFVFALFSLYCEMECSKSENGFNDITLGVIRRLEEKVDKQETRIKLLESSFAESETEKENMKIQIKRLQGTIEHISVESRKQRGLMNSLVERLYTKVKYVSADAKTKDPKTIYTETLPDKMNHLPLLDDIYDISDEIKAKRSKEMMSQSDTVKQMDRRISGVNPGTVAFYAYMSKPEQNPGIHYTFIFDTVVTNVGNGYNHHAGIFISPMDGVYTFTWTVVCSTYGIINSEILINSTPYGGLLTNSVSSDDWHSATGVVVKELNTGDIVYIRTNGRIAGQIQSYPTERTTFSGWKLS